MLMAARILLYHQDRRAVTGPNGVMRRSRVLPSKSQTSGGDQHGDQASRGVHRTPMNIGCPFGVFLWLEVVRKWIWSWFLKDLG